MPATIHVPPRVTKFTNCRLLKGRQLVNQDLWIDAQSGTILQDQQAFYDHSVTPNQVVDLSGRILAPGFIEAQLNGAQGFDFSVPQPSKEEYDEGLRMVNKELVKTGVTSYLPTVTSQLPEVYHQVLPSLGPSGGLRRSADGSESLGAHVEGPFISSGMRGIHSPEVLQSASSLDDLISCYGLENLPKPRRLSTPSSTQPRHAPSPIKMVTAAPEVGNMLHLIPEITARGIIYSIGHSDTTYEQALQALDGGATMVTHLFNAMRPFYHRNPGIFGLLGQELRPRPYYGVIADGIHLHPTSLKIAFNAHPSGLILVTDAMKLCGLPDGVYEWTNGEHIVKKGARLTLQGSDKLAGSSATLIECVNNFRRWSGASTAEAIRAVTSTPARMLGLEGVKGSLECGADADLVVLGEEVSPDADADGDGDGEVLVVDQVWKFGEKIFDSAKN